MGKQKPRLSLGTILTLCLTACVVAGCVFLYAAIHDGDQDARMDARKVIGVIGSVLHGPSPVPAPQSTVRTVTVTLAPVVQAAATPSPSPTASPSQAPQATYSFSLTLGGLLGFHSEVSDSVYNSAEKSFDYRPILSTIGGKVCSDLNLVTLPHVLNVTDSKYADVIAPAAILDGAVAGGFDALLLNTEHALDQGVQGALETVNAIRNRGLSSAGVNIGEARQSQLVLLNGARIALLAYTDTLTNKGKNTLETAEGQGAMQLFSLDAASWEIQEAKRQGANCVIVFMHWGTEGAETVTNAQRETARELAALGADLIVGAHSTRVLPLELIETTGTDGRRRSTLVAYSLGTLLGESREAYDISGMLLHLNITCGAGGVVFQSIAYTPTYIWRQSVNGKMQYRVVCSADAPPEGMDEKQMEVMGRSLTRIQNTLQGGPATQRQ